MARSSASHELFKDGVRAALHGWPVLQVNAVDLADRWESTGRAEDRPPARSLRFCSLDANKLKLTGLRAATIYPQ